MTLSDSIRDFKYSNLFNTLDNRILGVYFVIRSSIRDQKVCNFIMCRSSVSQYSWIIMIHILKNGRAPRGWSQDLLEMIWMLNNFHQNLKKSWKFPVFLIFKIWKKLKKRRKKHEKWSPKTGVDLPPCNLVLVKHISRCPLIAPVFVHLDHNCCRNKNWIAPSERPQEVSQPLLSCPC